MGSTIDGHVRNAIRREHREGAWSHVDEKPEGAEHRRGLDRAWGRPIRVAKEGLVGRVKVVGARIAHVSRA